MSNELARGYIQLIPTTKGFMSKVKEELGQPLTSEGKERGENIGLKLASGIKAALGAAAIGATLKSALDEGAALEQSLGGIETLYKDSANVMIENATKAYKTAGLSANEYMETVSSFSASLLASLGGDTAAAAEAANNALIDMSDNANKMGTDMESIQNAYMGFSKQNYTMLDNLKLGYGGTKTEMKRLLADAEKLTGVKYDINSLNDVYSAIHVIQDELDITGTTAREASTTLSGSFTSMQMAASNLMGYMVTGMDIKPAVEQLIDTATTFLFGNLAPAVGRIIVALPPALKAFVVAAAPQLKELLHSGIDYAKSGAPEKLLEAGREMFRKLVSGAKETAPQLMASGQELLQRMISGAEAKAPEFGKVALDATAKFLATLLSNAPQYLTAGLQLIGKLVAGFIASIPKVVAAIPKIAGAARASFEKYDWKSIGVNIIKGIANGLAGAAGEIASAAKEAASKALSAAKDFLGIHSPSRRAEKEIGEMIPPGTAVGIRRKSYLPALEMRKMGMEAMNSGYEAVRDSVSASPRLWAPAPTQRDGVPDCMNELLELLRKLLDKDQNIYLSNGDLVGGLLDDLDAALQRKYTRVRRGGA